MREIRYNTPVSYTHLDVYKRQRLTDELTQVRAAKHGRDTTARLLSEQLARQTGRREQTEGERVRLEKAAQSRNEEILELERETARLENRAAQLKTEETQILDKMLSLIHI